MSDFIDRQAAIDILATMQGLCTSKAALLHNSKIWQQIKDLPSVDAQPVKHGRWELAKDGWYCSACELYPPFDCDPEEKGIEYCPICGAKMDGAEDG